MATLMTSSSCHLPSRRCKTPSESNSRNPVSVGRTDGPDRCHPQDESTGSADLMYAAVVRSVATPFAT